MHCLTNFHKQITEKIELVQFVKESAVSVLKHFFTKFNIKKGPEIRKNLKFSVLFPFALL